jgi:hypothetical protein
MTSEQLSALIQYVKVGGQVLNPIKWKQNAITANYIIASVPALCLVLNLFDITDISISAEDANALWQIGLTAFGVLSNIVLSVTSKNINLNPFNRTTTRDLSDSDE